MGTGARILKNATFLTLGDKIGYLMQFIFFLYFARKFGVIPVGEYSFGFFLAYAFAMLADSGVSVYLLREVARKNSNGRQLFFDCLVLRSASLFIVFFIATIFSFLFFKDFSIQKIRVIACLGGFWIFNQLADVFLAELNGHEKMGRVALLGVWSKLMCAASGIFLIYIGLSYDIVMVAFPITAFIYLCSCMLVSVYSLGPIKIKFQNFKFYKHFFIKLLPFYFSVVLIEILNCQDILILGILQDDKAVGLYSSAIKIITFILAISAFVQVAIFPVLSRLFIESKQKMVAISEQILRYLILSSLPLSFGLAFTADKIIDLLYSSAFQESGIVLKIVSWAVAAGFIQIVFSTLLTAIDRQKEKVIYIGINFAISTILNVILIYHFSYIGASIGKLATFVLNFIFFIYLVSKYLTFLSPIKMAIKPFIACMIMYAFILLLSKISILYVIPLSGIVYLLSLLVMREFSAEEIFLLKIFSPKKPNF